jgi:hypothetical protein
MTLPKIDQLRRLLPRLSRDDAWELDGLIHSTLDLHTPGMPELDPFREALLTLPPEQLRELAKALDAQQKKIEKESAAGRDRPGTSEPPELTGDGVWTLRQEKVLCGKANCAKLHGPYWYGYRTIGQRTKKKYFGKKKPGPAKLAAAAGAMLQKEVERAEAAAKKKAAKRNGKK